MAGGGSGLAGENGWGWPATRRRGASTRTAGLGNGRPGLGIRYSLARCLQWDLHGSSISAISGASPRRRLPRVVFDYIDGGADAEITLRENCARFETSPSVRVRRSRRRHCDLRTTVLGSRLELPFCSRPSAAAACFTRAARTWPREPRARQARLTCFDACPAPRARRQSRNARPVWYQLYLVGGRDVALGGDRARTRQPAARPSSSRSIRRSRVCASATCATARRSCSAGKPVHDAARTCPSFWRGRAGCRLSDGRRADELSQHRPARRADGRMRTSARRSSSRWSAGATAVDPRALERAASCQRRAHRRRRAARVDAGADAVVVSNHGGRQLDGVAPTLRVLPEVVAAVRGQVEVLLDGGIRRGSDVVKALCLGARAVLIGRAYAYGLGAGGEAGVARAIEILRDRYRPDAETAGVLVGRGARRVLRVHPERLAPRGAHPVDAPGGASAVRQQLTRAQRLGTGDASRPLRALQPRPRRRTHREPGRRERVPERTPGRA